MGKDSTNNALFALGAIGSILLIILAAYLLATHFITLPDYTGIFDWINLLALFFIVLAILAIYRESGGVVPLLAMILFLIQVILVLLGLLNILTPLILSTPDPATTELILTWTVWIIWLLAFLLLGYAVWKRRDDIGGIATVTGVIFMIWGFVRLILRYLDLGMGPSIYDQVWFIGTIIIYLFALIYFIKEMRS